MTEQIRYYEEKLNYEMDPADLFDILNSNEIENYIIVDTRKPNAFFHEHIPQAISFPHRTMNSETVIDLDKSKTYICYCDGIGCNGSTKGALKLTKLGFTVRELIGGLEWWKKDGFETHGEKATDGLKIECAC